MPLFVRSGSVIPTRDDRTNEELTLRLFMGDAPEASTIRLLDGAEISLVPDSSGVQLSISGPDRRYRLIVPQGFHVRAGASPESGEGITVSAPGTYDLVREA